ncbi:hypothetical protein F383_30560 [Gossypium arboreum]|uniref:Uncharacterized protein n=1 Tax=Gossypium arboreum TaxID=29729 RepID=A0A0B0MWY0_GOSAR|nr:hypothetical protein F383_30560 [Gossypium arboreum]
MVSQGKFGLCGPHGCVGP